MSSFGTSAINKSGKKLAPKAPVRRKPQASAPSTSASTVISRASTADTERSEPPNKRQRVETLGNDADKEAAPSGQALSTTLSTQHAAPQRLATAPVHDPARNASAPGMILQDGTPDQAYDAAEDQSAEGPSAPTRTKALASTAQEASVAHTPDTVHTNAVPSNGDGNDSSRQTRSSQINPPSERPRVQVESNSVVALTSTTEAPSNLESTLSVAATRNATHTGTSTPATTHTSAPAKKQTARGRKGKQKETQTEAAAVQADDGGDIADETETNVLARGGRAKRSTRTQAASAVPPSVPATEHTATTAEDDMHGSPSVKRGRGRRKKVISDETVRDEDAEDGVLSSIAVETAQDGTAQSTTNQPKRTRRPRKAHTKKASTQERDINETGASSEQQNGTEQGDDQVTDNGTTSATKKRKRKATPDDAEKHEVDAATVTMNALTRDSRRGKKSKLEAAMQGIDWAEVKRRKEEAEQRAYEHGELERSEQEVNARLDRAGEQDVATNAPRTKIVNGQIVIDTSSLVVDRHAAAAADAANQPVEELEEDDITAHVTSHSWVHDSRRDPEERRVMKMKSDPWSETQTNQFYQALSMFGTDFFIISKMFPGKTRRQIKLKFVREERSDPTRINSALLGDESLPMDINVYATATGRDGNYYKDPEVLQQELRDEEQRQKEEIERQRDEQEQAQREKQRKAAGKTAAAQKERAAKRAGNKRKGKAGPGPAAEGVEVAVEPAPGT